MRQPLAAMLLAAMLLAAMLLACAPARPVAGGSSGALPSPGALSSLAAQIPAGSIVPDTLASRHLPAPRAVSVYVPAARGLDPIEAVIYLGDGQLLPGVAAVMDTLVAERKVPRLLLVGVHADRSPGPGLSPRAREYVFRAEDSTRFVAYERFLLQEVFPWAETKHGAPAMPERRAVLGFSNSANFAVQLGVRHPAAIGGVIAFSPEGNAPPERPWGDGVPPRFYLFAGDAESELHARLAEWSAAFTARGIPHVVRISAGGHHPRTWLRNLHDAVEWIFAGR